MKRYEYKVIDTDKHIEEQLNDLGAQGWQVVGVTTKKQLDRPAPGDHPDARGAAGRATRRVSKNLLTEPEVRPLLGAVLEARSAVGTCLSSADPSANHTCTGRPAGCS